mgnify:CR=1 FL=1
MEEVSLFGSPLFCVPGSRHGLRTAVRKANEFGFRTQTTGPEEGEKAVRAPATAVPKKKKGKFGILTEALDCTIRRNDKLSEGVVELTVCDSMEDEILEEAVTILTISLI